MKLILMGFDNTTETLSEDFDVTRIGLDAAVEILDIAIEEFVGDYELDAAQLARISELTDLILDPAVRDYFLGLRAD
ncbi:hypothetical protein ACFXHA_35325 [Nocardia sp. NPDC059240]|uniref:DUF7683 domain-containing protein n=1 Tax=Nocardia sp. NPDC059240 TaxID=3346786 RepID=UPI003682173D